MSSMYEQFETNKILEKNGIWIDYGDFRVLASFAGGSNKEYTKYLEQKTKPYRRAITAGIFTEERSRPMLFDVFAETIVKGWEIKDGEDEKTGDVKWKSGIHKKGKGVLEYNKENVLITFRNLPELFFDIQRVSSEVGGYRKADMVDDSKNS